MSGRRAVAAAFLALVAPAWAFAGYVVRGEDVARVVPPAGAIVQPYENAGYRLEFVAGAVEVRVDATPLESSWPFALPETPAFGLVGRFAREAAEGSSTRYEAVSAVLAWVGTNIRYGLDREQSQEPESVLARRRGYCTGIARLTVAMLRELGVESREVPGYRLERRGDGTAFGFHRWVEVFYPDRGWVFSDPGATQQFVPASYLRLSDERLELEPGTGKLLERRDGLEEIDLAPRAPAGVRVRPNDTKRSSATLVIFLDGDAGNGEATLSGEGVTRSTKIVGGTGRFLGLAPGSYELRVRAGGKLAGRKRVMFRGPVLAEVRLPADESPVVVGGAR